MARHLDALTILYQKLEVRYGKDDVLAVELSREIEALAQRDAKHQAPQGMPKALTDARCVKSRSRPEPARG
jgi:hypothetical protein